MQDQEKYFGRVYSSVLRDEKIPVISKAIYAYLAVMCGPNDRCFPGVDTITKELGINRKTFYKYVMPLEKRGIIEKKYEKSISGRFGHAIYQLCNTPCTKIRDTEQATVYQETVQTVYQNRDQPCTATRDTKENNNKETNLKRYTEVIELYNSICGESLPRALKLTKKRKGLINARMKDRYKLEDFRRVFEMAEASPFLKGKNDRGWRADFDWLLNESNMVKVFEGRYQDRNTGEEVESGGKDISGFKLW